MRTTVTLDPDAEAIVRRLMVERGVGFKQALNDAIRGTSGGRRRRVSIPAADMGEPLVDITKALQLAAALEDAESLREMPIRR